MSKKNAESATVQSPAADAASEDFMRSHEMSSSAQAPREIRISMVKFLTKGQVIASPREAMDGVTARADGQRDGYDVHLLLDEDRFRFVFHESGKVRVRYLHVSRVDAYEEWNDRDQSSPNKAA